MHTNLWYIGLQWVLMIRELTRVDILSIIASPQLTCILVLPRVLRRIRFTGSDADLFQ